MLIAVINEMIINCHLTLVSAQLDFLNDIRIL